MNEENFLAEKKTNSSPLPFAFSFYPVMWNTHMQWAVFTWTYGQIWKRTNDKSYLFFPLFPYTI